MYPQNKRISISVAFIYGDNIFYNLYHHISENYAGAGAGDTIGEIFLHFTK